VVNYNRYSILPFYICYTHWQSYRMRGHTRHRVWSGLATTWEQELHNTKEISKTSVNNLSIFRVNKLNLWRLFCLSSHPYNTLMGYFYSGCNVYHDGVGRIKIELQYIVIDLSHVWELLKTLAQSVRCVIVHNKLRPISNIVHYYIVLSDPIHLFKVYAQLKTKLLNTDSNSCCSLLYDVAIF